MNPRVSLRTFRASAMATNGWPESAPFDSIVVTAAPAEIPTPLVDQLRRSGRMVIPGGAPDMQYLLHVERRPDGTTTTRRTLPVRFVPLTRDRAK
jgi:protein-L-isoaspartate(D-aspartate) O-methyltransferase